MISILSTCRWESSISGWDHCPNKWPTTWRSVGGRWKTANMRRIAAPSVSNKRAKWRCRTASSKSKSIGWSRCSTGRKKKIWHSNRWRSSPRRLTRTACPAWTTRAASRPSTTFQLMTRKKTIKTNHRSWSLRPCPTRPPFNLRTTRSIRRWRPILPPTLIRRSTWAAAPVSWPICFRCPRQNLLIIIIIIIIIIQWIAKLVIFILIIIIITIILNKVKVLALVQSVKRVKIKSRLIIYI